MLERHTKLDNQRKDTMSLVMPVYGEAPYLLAAIESVYKSQNVEIEFILVLDRCTNSDFRDALHVCPQNVEMKIINSDNPGIVPALNIGIAAAKYELIARLDSDDLVTPDRFHHQVEFLNNFEEVVCVGTQLIFIDELGNEFGHTKYPTKHKDILERMKYQNCIGHPSVMFRKSAVQKVGGYRELLTGSEDYDLWLRLGEIGKILNLPLELTKYRRSKFQFTNQLESKQPITESASRVYAAMRRLSIRENLPQEPHLLGESNFRNISKIQSINSKVSKDLMAADYLNQAYRARSKISSRYIGITKVVRSLLLAGWYSPRLLLSFMRGHIRFRSVRDKFSNRSN